jgi:hypothetical protein
MQIGCCCNIEEAPIAYAAGYDFIECKVTSLLPEEEGDAIDKVLAQHQASPVPVRAFNVFVPKEIKIVGPTVDEERLRRYVENGLARVRAAGGELVVFGSGGARAIPRAFRRRRRTGRLFTSCRALRLWRRGMASWLSSSH